jgi:hypothetical protein
MWWTPGGERTLTGSEAALFKDALGAIVDRVRDDEEGLWQFDAPPFDDLRPHQKLAVLAQVGVALLREDQSVPMTALTEAAIAAVYESIRVMVEMEIDQPAALEESPTWRQLVLAACREQGIEAPLGPESEDGDEWDLLIDCLAGRVLWDEDWKDAEHHLDADPAASRMIKDLLGIDPDYYVAVPPDPSHEELDAIWATLRELTRSASRRRNW